jgi:hypothetical protein
MVNMFQRGGRSFTVSPLWYAGHGSSAYALREVFPSNSPLGRYTLRLDNSVMAKLDAHQELAVVACGHIEPRHLVFTTSVRRVGLGGFGAGYVSAYEVRRVEGYYLPPLLLAELRGSPGSQWLRLVTPAGDLQFWLPVHPTKRQLKHNLPLQKEYP